MPTTKNKNYVMLLLLLAAPAALADIEDQIARCARISSVGDRILCLEEALRQTATVDDVAIAETAVENETDPPELSTDVREVGEAIALEVEEVAEEVMDESTAQATTQSAATVTTSSTTETEQFGLSESQRHPKPVDSVNVVVVAVDQNAYKKLIFTTESGQVWLQSDQGTPRYRQLPFEAEIRRGASGSFFIQPVSGGIAVRVKRRK